jgi:hypothetical protein
VTFLYFVLYKRLLFEDPGYRHRELHNSESITQCLTFFYSKKMMLLKRNVPVSQFCYTYCVARIKSD